MNMSTHFQVVVSNSFRGSIEDWYKALGAPASELPPLSEEQQEMAAKFGISEEEYQRGLLVGRYGDLRQHERGVSLGKQVDAILLKQFGPAYDVVKSVVLEPERDRWVIDIGRSRIAVPLRLADAVIDSGTVQDIAELRELIVESANASEHESK